MRKVSLFLTSLDINHLWKSLFCRCLEQYKQAVQSSVIFSGVGGEASGPKRSPNYVGGFVLVTPELRYTTPTASPMSPSCTAAVWRGSPWSSSCTVHLSWVWQHLESSICSSAFGETGWNVSHPGLNSSRNVIIIENTVGKRLGHLSLLAFRQIYGRSLVIQSCVVPTI